MSNLLKEVCDTILKKLYNTMEKDVSADRGLEIVELVERTCEIGGDNQRREWIYQKLVKCLWRTAGEEREESDDRDARLEDKISRHHKELVELEKELQEQTNGRQI